MSLPTPPASGPAEAAPPSSSRDRQGAGGWTQAPAAESEETARVGCQEPPTRSLTLRGSTRAYAWLLLTGSLLLPRQASAAARDPAGSGAVVQVTSARAYLNRGSDDGLQSGEAVELRREGRNAGSCKIDQLAPHHASCVGQARVGDTFKVARPPPAEQARPAAARGPLPSARELDAQREAVLAAPLPKFEFRGGPGASTTGGGLGLLWQFSHTSSMPLAATNASFHQERVDLMLPGHAVGAGFRLYADLTALHWTSRPDNARFQHGWPNSTSQLYLRQLELRTRELGRSYTLAVGRVRPLFAPGMSAAFDGAQAGWRSSDGRLEAGLYGGALPDPISVEPRGQMLGGAYYRMEHAPAGSRTWLRHEARVTFLGATAGRAGAAEAEALGQGSFGEALDLAAGLRMGMGATSELLSAARLDLTARATRRLRVTGGYRYVGQRDWELRAIDGLSFDGQAHHADLSAMWEAGPLTIAANGGFSRDVPNALQRFFAGPELGLPALFGRRGGMSVGYAEDFGWLEGRTGWVQATLAPGSRWQLLARASYLEDRAAALADGSSQGATAREAGLYGHAAYQVTRGLAARLGLLARAAIMPPDEGAAAPPLGLVLNAAVGGAL